MRKLASYRVIYFAVAMIALLGFDRYATVQSLYFYHWWLDIVVHVWAGFLVAGILYFLILSDNGPRLWRPAGRDVWWFWLVCVVGVLGVAVGWEVLGWLTGRVVWTAAYLPDMFCDIVVTCIGAAGFLWVYWKREQLPPTVEAEKFKV